MRYTSLSYSHLMINSKEENQQFQLQGEATRSPYNSQTRGMVLQVYQYLRMRSALMCEADLEAETVAATGVSARTLQRIKKEVKEEAAVNHLYDNFVISLADSESEEDE
ncbi:hypothetical protein Pcinc_004294 [Petrolisthes cinctipes]|uniref:Uncharacterized protein n=1 Tax=Petrolisthes cinctipes TaxID=88211 RepID=A0AAE1GEZ1_PETCI|nr:hypothetical protein Pcinc_004294 [Petrolisthes cinctipes]